MPKDNPSTTKSTTKTAPSDETRMSCEAIIGTHMQAFSGLPAEEQELARIKILTMLTSDSAQVPHELRDGLDFLAQSVGIHKTKTR
jgi:hypothetical protein